MKIAIFASGEGAKASHLVDFFKGGNRVTVAVLLTDDLAAPVAARLKEEGIEVVHTEGIPAEELAALLKEREVELIVVDDYASSLPASVEESFREAVVYPATVEGTPLEVIKKGEKREPVHPQIETKPEEPEKKEPAEAPSEKAEESPAAEEPREKDPFAHLDEGEKEWAKVLDIHPESDGEAADDQNAAYHAGEDSRAENSEKQAEWEQAEQQAAERQAEQAPENQWRRQQQYWDRPGAPYGGSPGQGGQYGGGEPGRNPYQPYYEDEQRREPMPDTYLVWSVVITILCCLIPGIIAIIYSSSVSSKYFAGDIEGAKRASRRAQIWCIVSVLAGIVWATLYLPLTLFLG